MSNISMSAFVFTAGMSITVLRITTSGFKEFVNTTAFSVLLSVSIVVNAVLVSDGNKNYDMPTLTV